VNTLEAHYELTATCKGSSVGDIENALEEILRHVRETYTSGFGSNESSSFDFNLSTQYQ